MRRRLKYCKNSPINSFEQERSEFLQAAIDSFMEEAGKSENGFWRGVLKAITGAAHFAGFQLN